jgi:hypothetical protein
MTNPNDLRQTLLALRKQEEDFACAKLDRARSHLWRVRASIASIDETIRRCEAVAERAFHRGQVDVGRGNRREANGLRLMRARQIARLGQVKQRLAEAQQEVQMMAHRREMLERFEAERDCSIRRAGNEKAAT